MPDEISSRPRVRSGGRAAPAWLSWMTLVFMRFAVDRGPLSAPGYNSRGRVVRCPTCGKKVRLGTDGWGYCRKCRRNFDGRSAKEA
jgi:hypothetical protein